MPNRMLRDGILRSERVDKLSEGAELFYRRLMSVVDDYGRYYASPKLLRVDCYPLKDTITAAMVKAWLAECQAADGLVVLYQVDGKSYLQISDFGQRMRAASRFPDPPVSTNSSPVPPSDRVAPPIASSPPPDDRASRAHVRNSPSHDRRARADDSYSPPLRAGAFGGEAEGVVGVEGGGEARAREDPPPPPSNADAEQIAKLLQSAMPRGTPALRLPGDADILGRIHRAMQGAALPELAAVLIDYRRRRKPPDSYGFWELYLTSALSPDARRELPEAIQPDEEPVVHSPPKCELCAGAGVVGHPGATLEQVRAAIARGGKLCNCPQGDGWRSFLEMEDDVDGAPVIQRGAAAG